MLLLAYRIESGQNEQESVENPLDPLFPTRHDATRISDQSWNKTKKVLIK